MAGPAEAFPDLSNPAKLSLVATALHSALNLGASYAASNIKAWVVSSEVQTPPAPSPSRHLLADSGTSRRLVVLGYALAQVEGLPAQDTLLTLIKAADTNQKVADGLAQAEFLDPQHIARLSVGVLALELASTPQQAAAQLTGGGILAVLVPIGERAACQTDCRLNCCVCCCVLELQALALTAVWCHACSRDCTPHTHTDLHAGVAPQTPLSEDAPVTYTRPYYILLIGPESDVPDLTNSTVLDKVASALHSALGLGALTPAYAVSGVQVNLVFSTTRVQESGRKLLSVDNDTLAVLDYSIAELPGLPAASALEAAMADHTTSQLFARALAEAGFVDEEAFLRVRANLTNFLVAADATAHLENATFELHNMAPIGEWVSVHGCTACACVGCPRTATQA